MSDLLEKKASELTPEELEQLLKKSKDQQAKKLAKEKEDYEKNRDAIVDNVIRTAKVMHKEMAEFKQYCHIEMDKLWNKLAEYGKIRTNSKGGFQVENTEKTMRIIRRRDTEPTWDERSAKAVELIKDFLSDTIKKRDINTFEILMTFIEKNKAGDLEYSKVMELYSHEARYDDLRWKEGLRLIKESFSNHFKGYGYEFKIKNDEGKWENLILSFSSAELKLDESSGITSTGGDSNSDK
jgi:hypothetical protein